MDIQGRDINRHKWENGRVITGKNAGNNDIKVFHPKLDRLRNLFMGEGSLFFWVKTNSLGT